MSGFNLLDNTDLQTYIWQTGRLISPSEKLPPLGVEWDINFHPLLFPLHGLQWQHFWLHIPFRVFKRSFLYCLNRKMCLGIVSSFITSPWYSHFCLGCPIFHWLKNIAVPLSKSNLTPYNIKILFSLRIGVSIICILFMFVFIKNDSKTHCQISKQIYAP
jgi:hypothetical protein